MGIQTRTGKNVIRDAEILVCERRGGKEADESCNINTKLNKADLMTMSHVFEAHMRGCAMLGLRLSGDEEKLI